MKKKISRKKLKEKIESTKRLVDDIINERIDIPNNALVVDFDATLNIFTKKRIELIDSINMHAPTSIQELADISNRTKQAVNRDLKLLEQLDVIKRERHGKFTTPIVKKEIVVLNLRNPLHKEEEVIVTDAHVSKKLTGVKNC